jgi:hypothetical protein
VQSGAQLASQPYAPYTGQTVANLDPYQQQAQQQVGGIQGAYLPQYNATTDAYGNMLGSVTPETTQGLNSGANSLYANTRANVVDPTQQALSQSYGNAQGVMGQAYGNAQDLLGNSYNSASQLLNPYMNGGGIQQIGAGASALMSPYISNVLNPTMALGQQSLSQGLEQVGANANQAGAFGGSRQGVMEGVAQSQSALQQAQLAGNLLNSGWNSALTPALAAEQQGYGAASTLAGYGQTNATNLATAGGNIASALAGYGQQNANTLAGQYSNIGNAAQAASQSMANTNQAAGLTAAGAMPGALTAAQNQYLQQTNALNAAGQQQQQQQQNILNAGYGSYMAQQAWPYQQLQTFLSAVSGVPYSTSNTEQTTQQMPSNLLGQAIGGVASLGGLAGGVGSILNRTPGT